ncbi:G1 family endopeptidase [Saccharothrix violaceirubra]|uniref:Peptidase A4-like protein n=1 Tax=Saccharothrix violaceirubra TaxID=413306 RepID=A0A7W7T345_9PSEU|nr:G1 family glutamic endopeptidase [Saccharothrix violaceirubra]MBB4965722.1 hypothetical protein [Saccharothrix violaceirubra]
MRRSIIVSAVVVTALAFAPPAYADNRDSLRWAGYTSDVDEGSFDRISARWFVPRIECADGEDGTEVAQWIGLDGVGDDFVEQVGTTSECAGDSRGRPKYFAWVESFPEPAKRLFQVRPGDEIRAWVDLDGGRFRYEVHDVTLERLAGGKLATHGPGRSAEAVVEAPPGARLPDFDTARFRDVLVDGDPIGDLDPDRVTLVRAGEPRVVRAKPTALSDDGRDFDVRFRAR